MGGKISTLHALARAIWLWCKQRNIWLTACHLPGRENIEADKFSRNLSKDMEWMLDNNIFQKICTYFGTPNIDLFASRINSQLADYVSYLPDPSAKAVDAFSFVWKYDKLYYMFPPFSIPGQTLKKMETDRARAILVVPLWTTTLVYKATSTTDGPPHFSFPGQINC